MTYSVFGGTLNLAQSNPLSEMSTVFDVVTDDHKYYT